MGEVAAIAALIFSVISVRLMMALEKAQVVVAGTIGQQLQPNRIVAMAIGTHKFLMIKIGIVFFSRISSMIFSFEGMYQERAVQKAAAMIMNTTLISNKVRVVGRHTRHVARHVKRKVVSRATSHRRTMQ